MAFELFEKKAGVQGLAENQISVSKTSISFGQDFVTELRKGGYLEVYVDRINKQIGFRPVGKTISGYKVQVEKATSKRAYLSSSKVSSMIPKGKYIATFENGLIVINVPEILEEKKKSADIELLNK